MAQIIGAPGQTASRSTASVACAAPPSKVPYQSIRDLVIACRIDLGYDRGPTPSSVSLWNPVTWIRWARW